MNLSYAKEPRKVEGQFYLPYTSRGSEAAGKQPIQRGVPRGSPDGNRGQQRQPRAGALAGQGASLEVRMDKVAKDHTAPPLSGTVWEPPPNPNTS